MTGLVVAVLALFGTTESPMPRGQWNQAGQGTWDGIDWILYTTQPNDGGRCLALDTEPEQPRYKELGPNDFYVFRRFVQRSDVRQGRDGERFQRSR
jgi:hypothetical protein